MKIFLSMPMHGKTEEEVMADREKFINAITDCKPEWADAEFIDNVRKPKKIQGDRVKMLGDSIMKMADADLVIMCPHWPRSTGCHIEKEICSDYNIPVYFLAQSGQNGWVVV